MAVKRVFLALLAVASMWIIFLSIKQSTKTEDYAFSPALLLRSNKIEEVGQAWNDWTYNSDPHLNPKYDNFEDKYFKKVLDAFKGRPWHDVTKQHFRLDNIPTFFLYTEHGFPLPEIWGELLRHISAGECPFPCRFTEDLNLFSKADAVVLYLKFMRERKFVEAKLPPRDPSQPWIMLSIEDAQYGNNRFKIKYSEFDGLFNRSMTFRKDADIIINFGFAVNKRDAVFLPYSWRTPPYNISTSNSSVMSVKIATLMSHCNAGSGRSEYIVELQKYIEVDVYGNCGPLKCGETLQVYLPYTPATDPCLKMVGTSYMFYLAFENSICDDYVTEKVYNILYYPVVPIVLGGINYDEILPPHSFINAAEYTPSELATYVTFLVDNPEEYNKYFEWRQYVVPSTIGGQIIMCDLCTRLYDPEFYSHNVITKFSKWFDLDANCSTKWRPSNMSIY